MFGAFFFAQPFFADVFVLEVTTTGAKQGWPFGEDLSVPDARSIPWFEHVLLDEDDEVLTAVAAWLRVRRRR